VILFFIEKQTKMITASRFFVHHRRVSAVKRVEFVNDMKSYIVLTGRL
jgi:hypothetical protein